MVDHAAVEELTTKWRREAWEVIQGEKSPEMSNEAAWAVAGALERAADELEAAARGDA